MNESPSRSPAPPAPATQAEFCAALVLDSTGKIVATNESARQLWGAAHQGLVGTPVGGLLHTASTTSDAAATEVPWKTVTAALNQWASFIAQPSSGAPRGVRLRLERAVGGAGSYIAVVMPG